MAIGIKGKVLGCIAVGVIAIGSLLVLLSDGFSEASDFIRSINNIDRKEVERTLRYIASRQDNAYNSNGGRYVSLEELCKTMPQDIEICSSSRTHLGYRFDIQVSVKGDYYRASARRKSGIPWEGRKRDECLMRDSKSPEIYDCAADVE